MSFFTKVIYQSAGLNSAVQLVLEKMADAIGERLRDHDKEIAELRAEIERMKAEPRMSLAQKIRGKK